MSDLEDETGTLLEENPKSDDSKEIKENEKTTKNNNEIPPSEISDNEVDEVIEEW